MLKFLTRQTVTGLAATRPPVIRPTITGLSLAFATVASLLTATLAFSGAANAQQIDRPNAAGPLHSVWVYKLLCYDPMPDETKVEAMATQFGFRPITGAALKGFAPPAPTTYLKAWEVDDHQRTFKTAISKSKIDEGTAATFPNFANGTSIGCTVVLPAKDDPKAILASMTQLTQRKPDETYPAGPFTVSSWTGTTDTNVFLVYHYAPTNGKPGGLLSLVTLAK
ncbi:MAG: hypothetical protein AAFO73_05180 [Pseudomonadota bacterium]